MNIILDIFPIIIFFAVYKFYGIYAATGAAIIISFSQLLYYLVRYRTFKPLQLITFMIIFFFGGTTLLLHNPIYIKWKPSVIYWIFALIFLCSQLIYKKPFIQTVMGKNIRLSKNLWPQLNISWILFFTLMGILNLYVAYHYDTNTWVNFKLFGILGATFVFTIVQTIYISRFIIDDEKNATD
ncbi:MAG: septation protein A [Gammaproteobacteria bacterium RIFCSPHIGHO2_02_FULL_42_13]|nr:MAG: septation protein A [Gammaproteobacteria bacterium RIFCSPHIGHO2_02_FULL_42_13]OGT70063.1 MAG: septation protein A [Gammaproteobacteria bacterium RIFCSPLOWO2_02_FULL_42_9]